MTTTLDLVGGVVGLGTAIAKAADRPEDVDRAEWVGVRTGRLARCIRLYKRAKTQATRDKHAASGARWAAAVRDYERQHGYPSSVPVLPWEVAP